MGRGNDEYSQPESYSQAPPKEKDEEQTKSFFKVLQSIVLC